MKVFSPIPHKLVVRHNKCVDTDKDKSFVFDGENFVDVPDEIIKPRRKTYPDKYLNEKEFEEWKDKGNEPVIEPIVEDKIYEFEPEPGMKPKTKKKK